MCGACNRPGNATDIAFDPENDPSILVNMSVWESVEALRDFVYSSSHREVFRERAKWFVKMDKPHYCLWWVLAGHIPTLAEARERLQRYQQQGPTPFSFWFSKLFPAPAEETILA